MLIYHPLNDVNHCVFRLLLILEKTQHDEIDLDLYRIIDFYLLFPHLLKEIKPFPAELSAFKKVLKDIPEPYENMSNIKRVMYDLESIQTTSIQNLISKNFLNIDAFKLKKIQRTEVELPDSITNHINSNELSEKE